MTISSRQEYLHPKKEETIDYRADRGSEDPRTPNEKVAEKWKAWFERSQERDLKYFIPDWDDLVDPRYDFINERYSNSTGEGDRGSGGWESEVYAHQFYDTPGYDGLLVSREVIQKSAKKKRLLEKFVGSGGIHRYLRVPPEFPVMGDCGAFGYIDEDEPPYEVDDVLGYYTRHGFNYGISVDHLVIGADTEEGKEKRYKLTLENTRAFYEMHQERGLTWTPLAAVQGWNTRTYVEAAQQSVEIGYDYLAIGGLVRMSTKEVIHILEAIREAIGEEVDLHVLGVARYKALEDFLRLGVTSMDSATYLRRAWLSAKDNLWTNNQQVFTAIRIPGPKRSLRTAARRRAKKEAEAELEAEERRQKVKYSDEERKERIKAKRKALAARITEEQVREAEALEENCFEVFRAYDRGGYHAPGIQDVLDALDEYYAVLDRDSLRSHYYAVLKAKPWKTCSCAVCQNSGVEVAIFRGNNRNRRRGFHNTYVFYELMGEMLESGKSIDVKRGADVYKIPHALKVVEPGSQHELALEQSE